MKRIDFRCLATLPIMAAAVFHDLTMDLQGLTITFVDAQLSGETLFLRWIVENSVYPFTTAMHRKVTE